MLERSLTLAESDSQLWNSKIIKRLFLTEMLTDEIKIAVDYDSQIFQAGFLWKITAGYSTQICKGPVT